MLTFAADSKVSQTVYQMSSTCSGIGTTVSDVHSASQCQATPGDYTNGYFYSSCKLTSVAPEDEETCFLGTETVELENGENKMISQATVGDRVLTYNPSTQHFKYADVVAVPHAKNDIYSQLIKIILVTSEELNVTPDHLIFAGPCEEDSTFALKKASSLQRGFCLMNKYGERVAIAGINLFQGQGLYTLVTKEEFIVVNDFVCSPFGHNHLMVNTFYKMHRWLYDYLPKRTYLNILKTLYNLADCIVKEKLITDLFK